VVDGRTFQKSTQAPDEMNHLVYAYYRYWRPFLMLPRAEFDQIPDRANPEQKWRQMPWLLRGVVFPLLALPLILSLILLGLAFAGPEIARAEAILKLVALVGTAGLASIAVCLALAKLISTIGSLISRAFQSLRGR
jgi:hypothetical protein